MRNAFSSRCVLLAASLWALSATAACSDSERDRDAGVSVGQDRALQDAVLLDAVGNDAFFEDASPTDAAADAGAEADARVEADAAVDGGADQIIEADVVNPVACNEVCAAASLTCNEAHEWLFGAAGGYVEYSDGQCIQLAECTETPEVMIDNCGFPGNYTLTTFRCACR
jgi:hypothetical protein